MGRCIPLMVLLATACSGVGADLEIRSDRDLDRVELFIATEACVDPDESDAIDPCVEGVGWSARRRPPGLVLHMVDPLVVEAALSDPRSAAIHLELASGSFRPMAIAIVGYAGGIPVVGAELKDITIPLDEAVHLRVDLVDVVGSVPDDVAAPEADAPQHRVHVWPRRGHGPDHVGCAVYQTWLADKGEWRSHYYGPLDDPDCDNREIECDKYWFDRNVGSRQACLFDIHPNMIGGCRVGATLCEDGTSSTQGCGLDATQSNYCFHDALCAACEGAADVEACVIDQATTSTVGRFVCTFTPDAAFLPCTGFLHNAVVTLPDGCNGGDMLRLRLLQDDPLGLTTSGDTSIVVDGVTITGRVEAVVGACRVILGWVSGSAKSHPGADLMLDVWYPNQHLFVPVHIDFTPPAQCTSVTPSKDCAKLGRVYTPMDLECL